MATSKITTVNGNRATVSPASASREAQHEAERKQPEGPLEGEARNGMAAGAATPFGEVLHRVALTVNSSLDLKEILKRLADIALDAIPADRCHLFLLDDSGTKLVPTLSVGRVADMELWKRFKDMGPIDLKSVPARWEAFSNEKALGIPDMASSPLIPPEIVEVFRSRSALVAKLEAEGEPLGVFTMDWIAPGREFDYEEIELIQAIGGYLALAVRNAQLYAKLQAKALSQERLVEITGALNRSGSLQEVLDRICSSFEELLGTVHCSVNLIEKEGQRVRTLAVSGVPLLKERDQIMKKVSPKEIERVRKLWETAPEPVLYESRRRQKAVDAALVPESLGSAVLFPLKTPDGLVGFVIAAFAREGGPGEEALEYGQALAGQAATAIGKMELIQGLQYRLPKLEVLYRLSDVVAGTTDIAAALRRLNRVLQPELGLTLRSLSISNARMRETVGAPSPTPEEMEAIRSWRATLARLRTPLKPKDTAAGILVPIVRLKRVQGALRLVTDPGREPPEPDLMAAIGAACAEIIYKAGLHRDLAETERRLLVSAERDRIARDLHDSVGQILTGLAMRLNELLPEAPDYAWRHRLSELQKMAVKGSRQVRDSIHALLFLDVRKRGLARSLRELAAKFEATTGIEVRVKVLGEAAPILAFKEDALFRVVHEALMNVERHARASFVGVALEYGEDDVVTTVRDDGVGLSHRDPFKDKPRHFGLRALRQMIDEVEGTLEVRNAEPRGVIVEARLPRGHPRRRSKRGGSARSRR